MGANEILGQITEVIGLNVGGKAELHVIASTLPCVFFGIGLLHLNEISIELGTGLYNVCVRFIT